MEDEKELDPLLSGTDEASGTGETSPQPDSDQAPPPQPVAAQPPAAPQDAAPRQNQRPRMLSEAEVADQVINFGVNPATLYQKGLINASQVRELTGTNAPKYRAKYEALAEDSRSQRELEEMAKRKAINEAQKRKIEVEQAYNLEVAKAKAKSDADAEKTVRTFEFQRNKLDEARSKNLITEERHQEETRNLYARYWGGDPESFPREETLSEFTTQNYRIGPNGDEWMRDPSTGLWGRTRTAEQIEQDKAKNKVDTAAEREERRDKMKERVGKFREDFLLEKGRYPTQEEVIAGMRDEDKMISTLLGDDTEKPQAEQEAPAPEAAPPVGRAAADQNASRAAVNEQFNKPLTRSVLSSQDLGQRSQYVISKVNEKLAAQGIGEENMPEGIKNNLTQYTGVITNLNQLKGDGDLKRLDQIEQIQLNALMQSARLYEEMLLGM